MTTKRIFAIKAIPPQTSYNFFASFFPCFCAPRDLGSSHDLKAIFKESCSRFLTLSFSDTFQNARTMLNQTEYKGHEKIIFEVEVNLHSSSTLTSHPHSEDCTLKKAYVLNNRGSYDIIDIPKETTCCCFPRIF